MYVDSDKISDLGGGHITGLFYNKLYIRNISNKFDMITTFIHEYCHMIFDRYCFSNDIMDPYFRKYGEDLLNK